MLPGSMSNATTAATHLIISSAGSRSERHVKASAATNLLRMNDRQKQASGYWFSGKVSTLPQFVIEREVPGAGSLSEMRSARSRCVHWRP